jgi:hypothetical protein
LPDNKVQNGSKLGLAIPSFDGVREKWFNWKEMVEIKIAQFPLFGKAFSDEAEAIRDTVTSTVLYDIFMVRRRGTDFGAVRDAEDQLPCVQGIDRRNGR